MHEVNQIEEDEEEDNEANHDELGLEEVAEEKEETKKEVQRAKRPETPLENSSVNGVIEGSESLSEGFPSISSH